MQSQVAETCRIVQDGWRCAFRVSPWADPLALRVTAGDTACDADTWAAGPAWEEDETGPPSPPCLWPGQFWNETPLDGTSNTTPLAPVDAKSLLPVDALQVTWDNGAPVPAAVMVLDDPRTGIRFAARITNGVPSVPDPCLTAAGAACAFPRGVPFELRIYLEPQGSPRWVPATPLETTSVEIPCADDDGDGHCAGGGDDCDDTDPDVYPGAPETPYDGVDNDCDGADLTDVDGDGFDSTEVPEGTDCDDTDPDVHPGSLEIPYDGTDNDCVGGDADDLDGDGYASDTVPGGDDCDDTDPDIHPHAVEVPYDGLDSDCDGADLTDVDGDGFDATVVDGGTDCRDTDPNVYPGAMEVCDGLDNDCDGTVDEGLNPHYYPDEDGDGFGVADGGLCGPAPGFSPSLGDCDDADASVHPGAADPVADGIDSDCGGHDGPQPHVNLSPESFTGIQEAVLAASDGDTIWVGPGTYLEADITLAGRTIALVSTQGPEVTMIDAQKRGRVLVIDTGEGPETRVSGFTLTGGHADVGGGLFLSGTSPLLEDLVITANEAKLDGGGLAIVGGAPRLARVRVESNTAPDGCGGGAVGKEAAAITLEDVSITENEASTGAGLCLLSTELTATHVHMAGNAGGDGGALAAWDSRFDAAWLSITRNTATRGGGLFLEYSTGTLDNATFEGNSSDQGGGIYLDQTSLDARNVWVENNVANQGGGIWMLKSSPMFTSAAFIRNEASDQGGALFSDGCFAGLIQVVVLYNTASVGGGVYTTDRGDEFWSPFVANSVLAYNTGFDFYDEPAAPDLPIVVYSDVYNPGEESVNFDILDETVLHVDPDFLDANPDIEVPNFHLARSSPLVDRGEPSVLDPDGSPADLGIYGGSQGASWDRDDDGWHDYFWPGRLDDAPPGYDPAEWDPDDLDPGTPP